MSEPFVTPACGKNCFERLDTFSVAPPANMSSPSSSPRSSARSCASTPRKSSARLRGIVRHLAGAPPLHAHALERHVARGLVVTNTQENRLSQPSVRRPLRKLDFHDQLRRDPVRRFIGAWRDFEG